jgi:hypothetical protein
MRGSRDGYDELDRRLTATSVRPRLNEFDSRPTGRDREMVVMWRTIGHPGLCEAVSSRRTVQPHLEPVPSTVLRVVPRHRA